MAGNEVVMDKRYFIFTAMLLNIMLATGCGQLLNASVGMENIQENAIPQTLESICEITDTDRDTMPDDAVEISLNTVDDTVLSITEGGDYILSGQNTDCNIVVNVYDDEIVHFFLDDVDLAAPSGPAVYVEKAGKVIITLMEETENTISDSTEYATETEACIFSNSDLTINGSGQLSVYGYYHDAIRSKDRLKIVGTNLFVRAKNDGLRGNDSVVLEGSRIEIESEGTGVLTNSEQGYVVLQGGICKVTAGENAIAADSYVSIQNCEHDLYSVLEPVKCSGIKEINED